MIFGLSIDMLPHIYADWHPWLQPLASSSLSAGTICAVVLNLIFRIGISERASLRLTPGADPPGALFYFFDSRGRAWGARTEVIERAASALTELYDTLCLQHMACDRMDVGLRFDEYNLDVDVDYTGEAMAFAAGPPRCEDIIEDPTAQAALAGFLIGRYADRIDTSVKNGLQHVRLHFDH